MSAPIAPRAVADHEALERFRIALGEAFRVRNDAPDAELSRVLISAVAALGLAEASVWVRSGAPPSLCARHPRLPSLPVPDAATVESLLAAAPAAAGDLTLLPVETRPGGADLVAISFGDEQRGTGVLTLRRPGGTPWSEMDRLLALCIAARAAQVVAECAADHAASQPPPWIPSDRLEALAGLGTFEWDVPADTATWSDNLCRMLGMPPGSVTISRSTFLEGIHPEDRERVTDALDAALRGERPYAFHTRIVHPDGLTRWIDVRAIVLFDADSRPARVYGVARDVTEQKAAQQALLDSEEGYRRIFEASGDAIYVLDKDTGAILDANAAACALNGYSLDELKRLGIASLCHDHAPYDRETAQELIRRAAAGEPQRADWLARHSSGGDVWGEVTLQRVTILGEERVIATARNVTGRKAAERARIAAEQDAHGVARRMRAVARAAAGVIGADSVETLQLVLCSACEQVIGFDAFSLALYDAAAHTLSYTDAYDGTVWVPASTISAVGTPAERVIRSRRTLLTHSSADPDAAGAHLVGTGRRAESVIRTPVLSGSRVLGIVTVQSYTPSLYSETDVEVMETLASLAATALLNLELLGERRSAEAALRRANEELELRVAERTAELAAANRALAEEVAEHERARLALQARTEELEGVFRALPDMYFRLSADALIVEYRAGSDDLLYAPPEAFLGRSLTDVLPDEASAQISDAVEEVRRTGRLVCVEYALPLPDGVREYEARILSLEDRSMISTVRDITDRKRAERELQRREEQFRSVIENAYDLIQVVDRAGTMLYVSPSIERIAGYTPDELVGKNIFMLADPVEHETGVATLAEAIAHPGVAACGEFRVLHKDGSIRIVETFARTLSPHSAEDGVVVNARDITERKRFEDALAEREEWFRRLTENSSDLVQVIGLDGRMGYTGPSVQNTLGYLPEELTGRTVFEFVAEEDHARVVEFLARVVAQPSLVQSVRYRVRHENGRWRIFEAFGRTLVPDSVEEGIVVNARDITERHEAEEALRAREEHFRSLIENSSDVIAIVGQDGTIRFESDAVLRLFGYTPEEGQGVSAWSRVHPDDVSLVQDAFLSAFAEPDRTHVSQFRYLARSGRYHPVEVVGKVLKDPADGLVVSIRDVSERHRVEQALRESEARYRTLIDNAHDVVTILDLEGRIRYQSPQLERVLGYTAAEMVGRKAIEFVHPEDKEVPARALAEILASPGATFSSEYRFLHRDGSWRYLETFGRTLLPGSTEQGLVFNTRDVTERREAERALQEREEHFRRLIETSHDLIQTIDGQGRIVYTGPSVERLLGYTADQITGTGPEEFIHPDDREHVRRAMIRALTNPGVSADAEYRVLHKDGSWHWFEAIARTISTEQPELGIVANARDITERRAAEEALARAKVEADRARESAEAANRAKSEFLSRMSHELRTPMNSILGFAQLLDRAPLPPEQKKGVGHILKAGRHLLQLINEVLEIARIEAGRQTLSLEPVRIGTVLQEAVGLVRPLAAQWQVELEEGACQNPAAFVQADRQRLTQVLLNLLSNAIKYNRPGGRVHLRCQPVAGEDGDDRLAIRVQDTGEGIAADRIDQLFTPFSRLGAERSEVEGTGLGLALSQRLTEAMGGTLVLESTGPEGSVFRLELRCANDPVRALDETGSPVLPLEDPAHVPARLLYIEDNLANLSLVETILLTRPRWHTLPALQGQIGLELAREHVPDLILLDLHLPDISGEEVLARLREDPRTSAIPVVVITADATRSTVERLQVAGADAYLTKPLDIDEFLETLERFLPTAE
jgi:PAS domain S-box-containing protein